VPVAERPRVPPLGPARPGGVPIDPRMRQRRVEVQRAIGRRRLHAVVALAVSASVATAGVALLHSPLLGVRRVEVAGVGPGAAASVRRAADLRGGEPLVDVSTRAVAARVELLPWVASARVGRSWPSVVRVAVTVRSAVAQVPSGPGRLAPVALLDVTGRVVALAHHPRAGLPVLSGLGSVPPVGEWIGGPRAGTGRTASAGAARSVLGLAAGLERAGLDVRSVRRSGSGALSATVGRRASGAAVDFGNAGRIGAKVAVLRALAAAGALTPGARVDLSVPDRPAVTPGGRR
jgi:hypothetical protein